MKALILILAMFTVGICQASDDLRQLADSAYLSGNYELAVDAYQELAETKGTSAGLLFNLGNSFYHTGNLGMAMVNWERARRLDPGEKEINANIRYLDGKVEDTNKSLQKGKRMPLNPDEPSFFENLHNILAKNVTSDTWAIWGAVFFLLFAGCAALYMFSKNVGVRKSGFFGGFALLFASLVSVAFSFMSANAFYSEEEGVLTGYKCELLTEPAKPGNEDKDPVLSQGTKVRIISHETNAEGEVTWVKVRLNSSYIGWVKASDVEMI